MSLATVQNIYTLIHAIHAKLDLIVSNRKEAMKLNERVQSISVMLLPLKDRDQTGLTQMDAILQRTYSKFEEIQIFLDQISEEKKFLQFIHADESGTKLSGFDTDLKWKSPFDRG